MLLVGPPRAHEALHACDGLRGDCAVLGRDDVALILVCTAHAIAGTLHSRGEVRRDEEPAVVLLARLEGAHCVEDELENKAAAIRLAG